MPLKKLMQIVEIERLLKSPHMENLQLPFDFMVDLGELGPDEVETCEGLPEGEQVLGSPNAL